MTYKIKACITEDHYLVRVGMVMLLNKYHPDLDIIFEASNGQELLKALKQQRPDIILLDIQMPGTSGIKLIELITRKYPKIKIIVISAHEEITSIIEYVNKGAHSFLPKNCDIKELILTINKVYEKGIYYSDSLAKELVKNGVVIPGTHKQAKLNVRDVMFIKLLSEQKSEEEICSVMGLKGHESIYRFKRRLFLKTNSQDLKQLLIHAKEHQII